MKRKIIRLVIPVVFFLFSIYSLMYNNTAKSVMQFFVNMEPTSYTSESIPIIEDWHKRNFPYQEQLADLYGLIMKLLDVRVIENFRYIKDASGYINLIDGGVYDTQGVVDGMEKIRSQLTTDQKLIFVSLPKRQGEFSFCDYGQELVIMGDGARTELEVLHEKGFNCLDMDEYIDNNTFGLDRKNVRFKTDVHYTTEYEFWVATIIGRYLQQESYQLFDVDNVFDISKYEKKQYDFLGNTGRTVGKYYVGTDCFSIYKPLFQTDMTVFVPDIDYSSSGSFQEVVLNGYEENLNNAYTYWVTDYGHFESPCYYYYNNLATENSANVLMICDSIAMRTFSYLALACKKLTVLDPRFFNNTPYISNELESTKYDAIIFIGQSRDVYDSFARESIIEVNELPYVKINPMVTEDEYGQWVGNNGVCLLAINNRPIDNSSDVSIKTTETFSTILGWAVNFNYDAPFDAIYCRIGNRIYRCEYGLERQDVVDHFKNENMKYTGFSVTVPTRLLCTDDSIEFIGVDDNESCIYKPARYKTAIVE